MKLLAVLVVSGLLLTGCGGGGAGGKAGGTRDGQRASAPEPAASVGTIAVSSPAFDEGGQIPRKYTCRGDGVSPPLTWSGFPPDTRDLALVVDDPDAPGGGYVHWVVVAISPGADGVAADSVPQGGTELDASGGPGWNPPCPPSGTHHYRFTVYAIASSAAFAFSKDASLAVILSAFAANASAWGRLTGTVTADQ
ncbi:MAG TPA: YbhB/YbcL family Raf kinase inhibitor-like protein [Marmoricola sp.]